MRQRVFLLLVASTTFGSALGLAQDFDQASCDEFLLPKREVKGQRVGPASCLMEETDVALAGRSWRRLDMGITGTVDGFIPKTGQMINYLLNAPDLAFPQYGNPGPIYFGVGRYDMDKGSSMTLLYPLDGTAWNGKLWVTAHGRGRSFKRGNLPPWNKNLNRADPVVDINQYERLMLEKGYAVAKTRRSSDTLGDSVEVTLEDGTFYPEKALEDNAQLILDFTAVAEKALARRLGREPTRTYWYGHSAGGRIGRSINYVPGLNAGADGKPLVDGVLADDAGGGVWLPIVMKDGKDVLFATERDRQAFVPQIDLTHQLYNRESVGDRPDFASTNFLVNKRMNAKILRDKGLGDRHRMYEVRGISHSGGENRKEMTLNSDTLNFSLLMDRFIDILDAWVDKGIVPPPTNSDWPELGGVSREGATENPAIAFPEIACPLGVYSQPTLGSGATFFSSYTGPWELEPLNEDGVFVDMNYNGIYDHRETPTQAWRRLGLLQAGKVLTPHTYETCVSEAAGRLRRAGFLSEKTVRWYADQAKTVNLDPGQSQ